MNRKKQTLRRGYSRVLLKLSGEALAGSGGVGLSAQVVSSIAGQLAEVRRLGVQLAVVIGGGNFYRGSYGKNLGLDQVTGDSMGMLATLMNALALQNVLERRGVHTRVQSAVEINKFAEPYIRRRAMRHLEKGRVVIFAGGTGHPYFTTDTAAALRAVEIEAQILLKATNVDGIYDQDPKKNPKAKLIPKLRYMEALRKRLQVMDATALTLCMENKIPVVVFNLHKAGNIQRAVEGKNIGSRVLP